MTINIKDVLTLSDNNKYVVVGKASYESNDYYYIVDIKNPQNIKFCSQDNDDLVEINDYELINKLIPLFHKKLNINNILE